MRLNFATAPSRAAARAVIFGADTKGAGTSHSYVGANKSRLAGSTPNFSGDAVRIADNETGALPQNLRLGEQLFDMGNLDLADLSGPSQTANVFNMFRSIMAAKQVPIGLGGDHFIKSAGIEAALAVHPQCGVLYVDAHPDSNPRQDLAYDSILYDAWKHHGLNPAATSIVGLRSVRTDEKLGLEEFRPNLIWGRDFARYSSSDLSAMCAYHFRDCRQIYISIDLDGLDPISAPAVEAAFPGGPRLEQVLVLLEAVAGSHEIIGADISEFIPALDNNKLTALSAATLVKEIYSWL